MMEKYWMRAAPLPLAKTAMSAVALVAGALFLFAASPAADALADTNQVESAPEDTGYVAPIAVADAAGAHEEGEDHDEDDDHHEEEDGNQALKEYYSHYDELYGDGSGPELAVQRLVQQRDITVPYAYISMLMRIPNAFGEGAACVLCHSSNDPAHSYRGLDLSTCDGIRKGAMEPPQRALFVPGHAEDSRIRRHLRNNRMPFGVPFDAPRNTANIAAIKTWINAGAEDDDFFRQKVLPLFKDRSAFGGFQACAECHMSNQEPPSFHELNLTSYEGIMLGADSVAKAADGLPAVKIVIPGDAENSPLYQRLTENRMPAGISPSENRDHPNTQILMQWIDQGAPCD